MNAPESGRRSRFRGRVLAELRANGPRGWVAAFAIAAGVHGVAHGAMAACAGWLGESWVGASSSPRSGVDLVLGRPSAWSPWLLCLLGLGAATIKTIASAFSVYGQRRLAFQVSNAVRKEVTDHVLAGGGSEGTAATVAAVALRLRDVERGVDEGLLTSVRAAAQLAPLAVALIALSSRLAFMSILALLPFALVLALARRRFRAGYGRAAALAEALHGAVDELVRHVDLWRTFGAESRVRSALDEAGARAGKAAARADAARSALSGLNEVLAAGALLAAVSLSGRVSLDGGRGLVAFAAVFFLTYKPLRDLGDARAAEERGADALASLDALRSESSKPTATDAARAWELGVLEVDGVWVERDGVTTPPTSFRAMPGEIVAVVGPTGAGKTSLLRALLGLERAQGRVRYGGVELTDAGVGPAHRPFAWVPQEPAVVAGSLAANVALGLPAAGAEDENAAAREALERVGAGALVPRARETLDAGGPSLSGGERQWLALARALASELPVLLLDEPTAGLDAAAQRTVLETLLAVRGERTVVLVTHRTEPLALADRVEAHLVLAWAAVVTTTTISYLQGNYATPQTSQASVSVTFTAAQIAGDLNVVVVGWNDSTATVSTVTDKSGNAYARAVGPTVQTGIASQSIYYAKNIAAAAAGANAVTVTFSTSAAFPDIRILEYTGADLSNPVDVSAASSGSSATSSSGAVATTNPTDLIFGANLNSRLLPAAREPASLNDC